MEDKSSNSRTKICPLCNTPFSCCISNCWCSELPMIMPLTFQADCFCPDCLKKLIQEKMDESK